MNMFNIRNEFVQSAHAPSTKEMVLRDGQIVQGKIVKLYPNQRAEIQIGSHKMVAEITTPLSVGKQYFFQVQSNDSIVQLRVLSEQLQNNSEVNIKLLLQQLGLKDQKWSQALVQQLLQERIPFQHSDLQNALHILDRNQPSQSAVDVLKMMIQSRLPMTDNVFQSIFATKEQSITSAMEQMITTLTQSNSLTSNEQKLLQMLQQLTTGPKTLNDAMTGLVRDPQSHIRSLLQMMIPNNQTVQMQHTTQQNVTDMLRVLLADQHVNTMTTDGRQSTTSMQQIHDVLSQLVHGSNEIQASVNKLTQIFTQLSSGNITDEQYVLLKHMVEQQVMPKLPQVLQTSLQALLQTNDIEHIQSLHQLFQTLGQPQMYQEIQQLLQLPMQQQATEQPIQQQLLTHMQQFTQMIGMQDEAQIMAHLMQNEELNIPLQTMQLQSVKTVLLQLLQESNIIGSDKIQQFVHFINGMQLQSVQETNHFLHAAVQLPGEKLGLNEDLFMQFEGKKNEEGNIDPDYCRILFVLDLANIKETMIDMHVQKRIISIAIYNEQFAHTKPLRTIEKTLAENLHEKNYTLSSITYKRLYEVGRKGTEENKEYQHGDMEGIDFRI